ncbi:methyl-accepting chemotaxis protein [Ferrovibrio sp.]|uniref:methyl-accepting chemotaxis protein n=1 Tax=Ferrovibrio sp. TaxID=1917215 RepID=UPI003D0EC38B
MAKGFSLKLGIRGKIVAALVAFAVVPMLIMAGIIYYQLGKFRQDAIDQLAAMAVNVSDLIDRNLFERYGDVQAFGYNTAAMDPANWGKPGEKNPLVQAMDRYMANYGVYKLMLLVSPEGKVLAVNSKDAAGKPLNTAALYQGNYANAAWLRDALAGKFLIGKDGFTGSVVEQPVRHPELNSLYAGDDYAMIFAAPVQDTEGKIVAVWANFADMALVEDIAHAAHKQFEIAGIDNTSITILDPKGTVVVEFDPDRLVNHKYQRDFSIIGKLNLAETGLMAAREAVAKRAGGMEDTNTRTGVKQVTGYYHASGAYGYPGMDWSVLVRVPSKQAFDTLYEVELEMLIVLLLALIASQVVGQPYGNAFARPILRLASAMSELSAGKVDIDTKGAERSDEIGAALREVMVVRDRIVTGLQTKETLNSLTNPVILADEQGRLVFLNNAAMRVFGEAAPAIRREIPGFDAAGLLGGPIDTLLRDPALQQHKLATLTGAMAGNLKLGGLSFELTAVPVFDATGKRLGAAVEWKDVTELLTVQGEVASLVDSAQHGDFSQRVNLDGKSGFMREIAGGVNGMVDTMARAVNDIDGVMDALAHGRLSQRMTGQYDGQLKRLQENCNATIDKLNDITGKIGIAAGNVNNSAGEIATGTQDLAQRTESQAATLEQSAAAMQQVTETVRQTAENAQAADHRAAAARDIAAKGGAVVNNAMKAMGEIENGAQRISEIMSLIDEIAFQTNLLALNASVEAARAGEAGKGFAVVAQEVRALAQRSAGASKDIKALIQNSNAQVKTGVDLVGQTGKALEEIVGAIKQASDLVAEIAAASGEQARAMQELNTAILNMDEMTQRNGALVEETSAATQNLAFQANELADLVGFFDRGGETLSERRRESRFDLGPSDTIETGGRSYRARNWSQFGMLFGPVEQVPALGTRLSLRASLQSVGMNFAAEATVVRLEDNMVAVRYFAEDSAKVQVSRHFSGMNMASAQPAAPKAAAQQAAAAKPAASKPASPLAVAAKPVPVAAKPSMGKPLSAKGPATKPAAAKPPLARQEPPKLLRPTPAGTPALKRDDDDDWKEF